MRINPEHLSRQLTLIRQPANHRIAQFAVFSYDPTVRVDNRPQSYVFSVANYAHGVLVGVRHDWSKRAEHIAAIVLIA